MTTVAEDLKARGVPAPVWFCALCRTHAPADKATGRRTGDLQHRRGCWWGTPETTIPQG